MSRSSVANPLFEDDDQLPAPPPRPSVWRRNTLRRLPSEPDPYFVGEDASPDKKKAGNPLEYFAKLRRKVRRNKIHIQTMRRAGISVSSLPDTLASTSSIDLPAQLRPEERSSPPKTAPSSDSSSSPSGHGHGEQTPAASSQPTKWTPQELATRIANLISPTTPDNKSQAPSDLDTKSATTPIPPDHLKHVQDPALLEALCSSDAMNGSKGKPSVWDMLTRRTSTRPPGNNDLRSQRQSLISDGSSIMLYSPLLLDQSDRVEVARSEVRSICFADDPPTVPDSPNSFNAFAQPTQPTASGSSVSNPSNLPITADVNMWVPSRDKISVQMFWWGYRIYLPPPVLETLNNTQLEAAKRAALITASLKWLITNLPAHALPPQLQPITFLLTGLVPLVGCIGGFLAWSWTAIKSFDHGYGVYLSATWLLPIALIPGTWHEDPESK